jgi:multidrug efflux pump subunit AcrA (membrane-fusion protein)
LRAPWTWTQRISAALIAAACVFSALWYAPHVIRSERRLLTGTVTSSGVRALNFTAPGKIRQVNVRLGQRVRKGQVLASESAPYTNALISADRAAIAYDRAQLSQLRAARVVKPTTSAVDDTRIAVSKSRLARDKARLAADRLKLASTRIVAPSSGTVVAANGRPGETATASGVRQYVGGLQRPLAPRQPEFSLVPEGPQSVPRASPSAYALPVIALRTAATWQIVALIPEHFVSKVTGGSEVTVNVPAADVREVSGRIDAVLPTPVPTSTGTAYQATVTVTGHSTHVPLNGMAADILVGS